MTTGHRDISVIYGGLAFSGHYSVMGELVSVGSAYGSKSASTGGVQPDVVAEKLLMEIVHAWCAPLP